MKKIGEGSDLSDCAAERRIQGTDAAIRRCYEPRNCTASSFGGISWVYLTSEVFRLLCFFCISFTNFVCHRVYYVDIQILWNRFGLVV